MPTRPTRAARLSTLALLVTATATLVALVVMRPRLVGSPEAWSGDDLAFACAWLIATACAAWLALTTSACLTQMIRGHQASAARIAGWAPPVVRRVLQAALVGTWALVPGAAYATPAASPFILHVGPGGRITTLSPSAAPDDTPVVRAPQPTTTTTAPAPARTTTTTSAPSTTSPIAIPVAAPPVRASHPSTPAAQPTPPATRHTSIVRAGDNLWRIARAETSRRTGVERPDNSRVAEYWQRVVAANRTTLRSGDPSLIFPGEIVTLP